MPADKIVLIVPPFVQLSGPPAATAFLAGAVRAAGGKAVQYDLSIDTALRLFSRAGLERLFARIDSIRVLRGAGVKAALGRRRRYLETIDPVIAFLQGRCPQLAYRIIGRGWLPEGPRFAGLEQAFPHFGDLEIHDGARHLASLYLDDLQDLAAQTVLPGFGLSKYQEALAVSAPSLSPLLARLREPDNLLVDFLAESLAACDLTGARLAGITVPFPGNLLMALHCARLIRSSHPELPIVLGGGYVSTELRELGDGRLFELVDWLCFDDGAAPLLGLSRFLAGDCGEEVLVRTMGRGSDGAPRWFGAGPADRAGPARPSAPGPAAPVEPAGACPAPQAPLDAAPDYAGLDHGRYLSLVESPNPMHRLWSERGFFKLRMAEGCYWHRCAFCDTSLDYIARYRPMPTAALVDQVRTICRETGLSGIHFVDEAMPAAGARRFALAAAGQAKSGELPPLVWWGNVRYDRSYRRETAEAMAEGGCVGVSGGMEGVHPRILAAMDKGCTIQEMAAALAAFADSGIMTHAYLIHGWPGTTVQETVDALEIIRQCFAAGILHSAFWHRFVLTAHSPAGRRPADYGISRVIAPPSDFARNDLAYEADGSPDTDWMASGLRTAVHNWMNRAGLDLPVNSWFDRPAPPASLPPDFINPA